MYSMTLKKALIPLAALATFLFLTSCTTQSRSVAEEEKTFSKAPVYPKRLFNNDRF